MTAIDPQSQVRLQEILRRESRSVLVYVGEAYPWTAMGEETSLSALRLLIDEEREATADFGRFLVRQRIGLPYLPSFPASFTTTNFIALDYLLPRLIESERQSIAELERDLAALRAPAARAEVEKLLAIKRRHLPELQAIVPTQSQASLT